MDAGIYPNSILLSEIFPAPAPGEEEFIELVNIGEMAVDLKGWQLDDQIAAGSKPFLIKSELIIQAGEILVFPKNMTKLSLNNDQDTVNLIDPKGRIRQSVGYAKGKKGQSYAYDLAQGIWSWTEVTTSGAINQIKLAGGTNQKTLVVARKAPEIRYQYQNVVEPVDQAEGEVIYIDLNQSKFWMTEEKRGAIEVNFGQLEITPLLAKEFFHVGQKLIISGDFWQNVLNLEEFKVRGDIVDLDLGGGNQKWEFVVWGVLIMGGVFGLFMINYKKYV
jgi:hypothetical protein